MPRYGVYGITMATDHALGVPLPASDSPADVSFEVSETAPDAIDVDRMAPTYAEGRRPDGQPHFAYHALGDRDVVRLIGAMDFHCWPDRIVCHLRAPEHSYLVEVALFGMVLSLWLERRGRLTFHGSTVVVRDRAVAFLSRQGGGKTSTVAAFIRAGHALLADDLLVVGRAEDRMIAEPGYPQLRLWPEQARYFVGTAEGYPTFHPAHDKRRVTLDERFGRFQAAPAVIGRLYLLRRGDRPEAEVMARRLPAREAAISLVTHSYLPREMTPLGLQPARLAFIADMLHTVAVYELEVPLGLDELPRVVSHIEAEHIEPDLPA